MARPGRPRRASTRSSHVAVVKRDVGRRGVVGEDIVDREIRRLTSSAFPKAIDACIAADTGEPCGRHGPVDLRAVRPEPKKRFLYDVSRLLLISELVACESVQPMLMRGNLGFEPGQIRIGRATEHA
jgi:hypothetical protein